MWGTASPLPRLYAIAALSGCLLAFASCGGGGGGSNEPLPPGTGAPDGGSSPPPTDDPPPDSDDPPPDSDDPPPVEDPEPTPRQYRGPGDYASIAGCTPIEGDSAAPLKIVFIDISGLAFFDTIVADAIDQLDKFEPFNDDRLRHAVYAVDIGTEEELNCDAAGTQRCDNALIDESLNDKCDIDDLGGVFKIAVLRSSFRTTADEVIYLSSTHDEDVDLGVPENDFIHELAHNFGLADLYAGWLNFDGSPSSTWSPEFSRNFLNVDGPGCPKWCNSFKPASEYVESPTAICATFETKDECVTFNRDDQGDCPVTDDDNHYQCCVWDDEQSFEYFGGQCAPYWGNENIGTDCLAGSGCYFGAATGQYAWRPVRRRAESLMYSTGATSFSSVGLRALNEIVDCCLTGTDGDPSCKDFRRDYADFLHDNNFKHRVGSCAVIPTEDDPPIFSD